MPRKQWFLSSLLFLVSAGFLFYSKSFFPAFDDQQTAAVALPSITESQCNVVLLANKDYYPFLKNHFQNAEKKILGTVYLFKTASYRDNEPSDLMRELIAARKRNVAVDLVLDLASEDRDLKEANLRAADTLRRAGINVHFDTAQMITHAKTFVIDDRYCFVGSHNVTHAALSRNAEASIFLDSPEMAKKLTEFIRQIPVSSPVEKR